MSVSADAAHPVEGPILPHPASPEAQLYHAVAAIVAVARAAGAADPVSLPRQLLKDLDLARVWLQHIAADYKDEDDVRLRPRAHWDWHYRPGGDVHVGCLVKLIEGNWVDTGALRLEISELPNALVRVADLERLGIDLIKGRAVEKLPERLG